MYRVSSTPECRASTRRVVPVLVVVAGLLAAFVSGGAATAGAAEPTFSMSSSGTPSITVAPDSGLAPASGTPDASGTTNVFTTASIAGTGFASSDTGGFAVLECNDDPNQPSFPYKGELNFPVGCAITIGQQPPTNASLISGNVGAANSGSDSVGGPANQDAARYPCPPTPDQQMAGDVCALVVVGLASSLKPNDVAAQPLEWAGQSQPTMTVTGTAPGKAYPGEIVGLAGSGWPISPANGASNSSNTFTGTISVCDESGCMATGATAAPPSVDDAAQLAGSVTIPATPGGGMNYPCTSGCYAEFHGSETMSEAGLTTTVAAVDSAPVSIDASNEPVPIVARVNPSWSVTAGGNHIVLLGSAFTGATRVDFCTQGSSSVCVAGTGLSVINDDALSVVTPAGSTGTDDIVVTNATGRSATNPVDEITYQSLAPNPGYWMLSSNGDVYSFGSAIKACSNGQPCPSGVGNAVGMAPALDGDGFWVASRSGSVTNFGSAPAISPSRVPPSGVAVVTIAATRDGGGYWLATSTGQVIAAGDAPSFGDLSGKVLNAPVVNMVSTPDGRGYWLLAADGGVFTFGSAKFFGSTGNIHLNKPAVAMAPTADGRGYWFVASDGGVFAFGDAAYPGSAYQLSPNAPAGGSNSIAPLNRPADGIVGTNDGGGYWMVAADGGVFTFGDAGFVGSLGGHPPPSPIVGFTPS
jgi:hypothetical protein